MGTILFKIIIILKASINFKVNNKIMCIVRISKNKVVITILLLIIYSPKINERKILLISLGKIQILKI